MEKIKIRLDYENGIAAFIEEKEDGYKRVVYINKNGKELLNATILGSTVAYKLKLKDSNDVEC
ncbi:MAG: hypothetical protein WBF90_15855 [Rivularia sp. (in: cyanobacteria)]|jgi:hypothetical protein